MLVSDATTSAAKVETATNTASAASTATADFQNFLQLLTTQLRYQDPTAPLDATQFVSQLASFSTVEQLVSANERLDGLTAALAGGDLEKYSSWIGLNAQIADGIVDYAGSPVPVFTQAEPAAASAELVIADATGAEIDRRSIPNVDASAAWDGIVAGSPASPGNYVLSVDYFDANGTLVDTKPVIVASKIADVRLTADGAEIGLVDGRRKPIADIVGIGE